MTNRTSNRPESVRKRTKSSSSSNNHKRKPSSSYNESQNINKEKSSNNDMRGKQEDSSSSFHDLVESERILTTEFMRDQCKSIENLEFSLLSMKSNVSSTIDELSHGIFDLKRRNEKFQDQHPVHSSFITTVTTTNAHLNNPIAINSTTIGATRSRTAANNITGLINTKQFHSRDSRLSELLKIKDFETVYNIFVAALPILGLGMILQSYVETGKWIDFSVFTFTFGKLDLVMFGWIGMFFYVMTGYYLKYFHFYVGQFYGMAVQHFIYIVFQTFLVFYATAWTLGLRLPPASGLIIMCEQVRYFMKLHSFYHHYMNYLPSLNNNSKQQQHHHHNDEEMRRVGFSHYLYFLFCPTLLYRTKYPRTPFVRWSKVFVHLTECSFILLYLYILFVRYLLPIVKRPSTLVEETIADIVMGLFNSMMPGMIVFVFGFFGFLHCWCNMWAELLQFGDREFYRDWWNSQSFAEYYRKWNGVVYDWIHQYIYLDLVSFLENLKMSKSSSRMMASLFIIEVSAIIHEYILSCAFGFWFPVLWVLYGGPGLFFVYMKSPKKTRNNNIFVWNMLLLGCGLMIVSYSREYYARIPYVDPDLSVLSFAYWQQFFTSYSLQQIKKIVFSV